MGASIDGTTVIMDRSTGLSKCYGFAKFSSVEHARAFVEPNFPSIPWKERGGPGVHDGLRIKINYSQKSGGWREDQGATARLTEDQRRVTGESTLISDISNRLLETEQYLADRCSDSSRFLRQRWNSRCRINSYSDPPATGTRRTHE